MILKGIISQYESNFGQDIYPPNGIRKEMIDRFMKCLTDDEKDYIEDVLGRENYDSGASRED